MADRKAETTTDHPPGWGISIGKKPSELFPNTTAWPVKPPDENWLKRWHWLRDEDGRAFLAQWHHEFGWLWGWSGKPDIEDMEGWVYLEAAQPPLGETL